MELLLLSLLNVHLTLHQECLLVIIKIAFIMKMMTFATTLHELGDMIVVYAEIATNR
jgi:hypothetical protein